MVDNLPEADDFLERIEEDWGFTLEDLESVGKTKSALNDIFETMNRAPATDRQAQAIFNAGTTSRINFRLFGINRLQYTNRGRIVTRYSIPGRRGLFNFKSALDHYQNNQ